jgi:cob(I)alamin adenosyltransferase
MPSITASNLTFILAFFSFIGIIFTVYSYFRNPQIKTDQVTIQLQNDLVDLERKFTELKETHLRSVEEDVKRLTFAVNELSKTVIKLSTIIDERIPKIKN